MNLSRKSKGLIMLALFAAVAVLSWIGLSRLYPESNTLRYLPDRIYRIIKILMGTDPTSSGLEKPDTPWQLIIVKLFSIYILALLVFKGLQKFFHEQWVLYSIAFMKNHNIVVGMGEKSLRLLKDMSEQGMKAVVIEQNEEHPHRKQVRKWGHATVFGDASDDKVLEEAACKHAQSLVCFLDDEQKVLNVAKAAKIHHQDATHGQAMLAHLHFRHPRTVELLQQSALCQNQDHQVQWRFFNIQKMVARQFMQQLAHDLSTQLQLPNTAFRLVLLGLSSYNQAILIQALRLLHLEPEKTVEIIVCSEHCDRDTNLFADLYPQAHHILPLRFMPFDGSLNAIAHLGNMDTGHCVMVCANEDSEYNLSLALELWSRTQESASIYCLLMHLPEMQHLLGNTAHQRLHFFGSMEDFCRWELLTGSQQDRMAQAIHADYLGLLSGANSESQAYTQAWEALSEDAKDANRAQADHVVYKLAMTNRLQTPNGTLSFNASDVETLAQSEHRRWMAHRYLHGWQYGAKRDDGLKHHPSLVAWDDLSEAEKQKDRDTVLRLPHLLTQQK